ncbi:hypothetical protein F0342_21665 [Bacillus sp. CH30_1T]|uniref:hypothetical protein n=1 Tax=Bacillus sp. CH30_1T TaxID=2604836 RepID=UPI0011EF251A|nr:hypothetical protein [Bacillus sp. CH30_1T]KAA0560771.1 hypothetical protein F0342_21665 [Bacillus sp. CH30_1T]
MENKTTNKTVFEVDASGDVIGFFIMSESEITLATEEGRRIIREGWHSQRIFKPKYDFESNTWIEGLDPVKLQNKLQFIEKQEKTPTDEELNAVAIMELTQLVLGGGE